MGILKKCGGGLICFTVTVVFLIVILALCLQGLFLYNHFTGKPQPKIFSLNKVEVKNNL